MYSYLGLSYLDVFLVMLCISIQYVASFLTVEELTELTDGPSGCGELARGWVFICLELQCDRVDYTHGGRQKTLDQTRRCC